MFFVVDFLTAVEFESIRTEAVDTKIFSNSNSKRKRIRDGIFVHQSKIVPTGGRDE